MATDIPKLFDMVACHTNKWRWIVRGFSKPNETRCNPGKLADLLECVHRREGLDVYALTACPTIQSFVVEYPKPPFSIGLAPISCSESATYALVDCLAVFLNPLT